MRRMVTIHDVASIVLEIINKFHKSLMAVFLPGTNLFQSV